MNLGATVTAGMEGQATPTQSASQSDQPGQGQTYPPQTSPSNQQPGQGQAGPRVIRISHQAVPVVMMQMNTDGVLSLPHPPLIDSCLCASCVHSSHNNLLSDLKNRNVCANILCLHDLPVVPGLSIIQLLLQQRSVVQYSGLIVQRDLIIFVVVSVGSVQAQEQTLLQLDSLCLDNQVKNYSGQLFSATT